MKRLFTFAFAATLLFGACKKDWDCSCEYEESTTGASGTSTTQINDAKEDDAQDQCDTQEQDLENNGWDETNCELSER